MSPFLSLCMIVKNEEKVLRRCLDSVKDAVDEIVIVDTGSTDKTVEIAYEYTNKVFNYKWTNNFSEARNYAQSKALGQWILVMDADEYAYLDNLRDVVNNLKKNDHPYDAYDVKIFSFTGYKGQFTIQHWHTRIYKNDPSIKYYRTIHEQLQKNDEHLSAGLSDLVLYHSGYLANAIDQKDKRTRNKGLIDKEIKKSGLTGFDYFNLGNEYSSMGNPEKGLYYYKKAYQNKPDFAYSWVSHCLVQMVNCLVNLNRYQDALDVIHNAERIYTQSPDFKSMKARIYIFQGRMEDAEVELKNLIDNKEKYQQIISSPDHLYYYPNKWMGMICEEKKMVEKAVVFYSKALNFNFNDEDLIKRYFSLLFQYSSMEEVYRFISDESLLDNETNADRLMRVLLNLPGTLKTVEKLSRLDVYKNKKGISIKLLWKNNQTDKAFNLLNKLSFKQLLMVLNEGFFDFTDFILLCLAADAKELLHSFAEINEGSANTIHFLLEENGQQKIETSTYLALLKRTICLEQFELFERLLKYRFSFDQNINIQIGHLLYNYHFYDLAVSFYQNAETHCFDQQTYLNLINECKKRNMEQETFNFAVRAIELKHYNFKILKDVGLLTHKMGAEDLQVSIQQLALECYPDSRYLKEYTIWGEKKKKIALVYSPFSGSNVKALIRSVPDRLKGKYEINIIEPKNDLTYFEKLVENDAVVTTEGNYPFDKKNIGKAQKVIELWHGFPLKAMGLMDQSETNKEEIENRWKNTDSVISYSKLFNQVMGKCFGINEERFKVTGSPRNDLLLNADGKKNLSKLFHIKANKYKFIFYMPTWRTTTYADRVDGSQNNNLFNMSQFDLSLFDQFLREHHIKLVIKLHPAEEMKALKEFEQYRSIFVVTEKLLQEKDMDIYEVLNGGDLLITDYSSVYFDFLLMNRPIIFTPTDIEAYSRTRGFVLNPYEEWTPGPKVLTQLDLTNEIVKSLDDPDYYKQDRIKIKNIVHDYQDAQSANRVWHLIEQTMNEQILNYK